MASKIKYKDNGPRPPPANSHFVPAVVSFVSAGLVVAIGDLRKHGEEDLQVAFTSKHTGTDLPYLGFRIKLRRSDETKHLHADARESYHHIYFKYLFDQYTIEHGKADRKEKAHFLDVTNNRETAQRVCADDKLYVIKFLLDGKDGPEVHGFGSSFVGANDHVNNHYNHLSSIPSSQVIDVYVFHYESIENHLEWSITDQSKRSDPLLHYYHTSKNTPKPQGYVQWNRIIERDISNDQAFQVRRGNHNFDDFTVLQGNAEAFEQKHFLDMSISLRGTPVKMALLSPPDSSDDYYFAFVFIHDWEQHQHILEGLTDVLVCWTAPPAIKPQSQKEDGEKDPKDNPLGWRAVVMEDNAIFSDAPLTLILRRPAHPHPLADKKMSAATTFDEEMPMQWVYLKVVPSVVTVTARLKALDKHRYHNNSTPEFDEKRRLLIGRDLQVTQHVDLLHGIPQNRIDEILANLNASQKACIQTHCRDVHNGINLIHGPFGSGKTVLVQALCEIHSARTPGSKTFVCACSNSTCDAIVPKFAKSNLMVVRAHPLSLERAHLLQPYFENQRAGILADADPLPDIIQSQDDIEENDDDLEPIQHEIEGGDEHQANYNIEDPDRQVQDELKGEPVSNSIILKATLDILKLCQQQYLDRARMFSPDDPRMVMIHAAIHTWILKFAGILQSDFSRPTAYSEFRRLYSKSQSQNLNDEEWNLLKNEMIAISHDVLIAADVIIATPVQAQTDLLKDIVFENVIVDEVSLTTHLELLCAWRGNETLTLIGDPRQLPTTTLTNAAQNPFVHILIYGPFERWVDLGMRVFMLKEVMRMTAGLEAISNEVFYESKLVCGEGTSPDHPSRKVSKDLQAWITEQFPRLRQEPEGLIYPIFFDVRGTCVQERNGSSRVNAHNTAFIIDLIRTLLFEAKLGLTTADFGIATPYAGQVRSTRLAFQKANLDIPIGTTEYWQGKEKPVMIVDFVRAGNDQGSLGFLTKKERLNVLLSRQQVQLFVVGDQTCLAPSSDPTAAPSDGDPTAVDPSPSTATTDRRNRWVMQVIQWFKVHNRIYPVDMTSLKETYLTFTGEAVEEDPYALGGWGDEQEDANKDANKDKNKDEKKDKGKEKEKDENKDEKNVVKKQLTLQDWLVPKKDAKKDEKEDEKEDEKDNKLKEEIAALKERIAAMEAMMKDLKKAEKKEEKDDEQKEQKKGEKDTMLKEQPAGLKDPKKDAPWVEMTPTEGTGGW